MQKVVSINLNGNAYQLEEAGYEALRAYLERAEARLQESPDRAEIMADMFNLFDCTNYDVNSVIGGQYLSGPTLANPALPYVTNSRYRQFTATLPPFEVQIGIRVGF